ncbi:MAG: transcription antitermination factor NusB [Clostridia bacterium]|nr:transcription antitermination factor NusB [Clostridia bacterium]
MTRKQARDLAFKLLYQADMQKETVEEILNIYNSQKEITDESAKKYIVNVLFGVEMNLKEIDEEIAKYLKDWSINRISKISLASLRLGIFEIKYCEDIPNTVAVNEAVSLVKTYENEKNAGFVNGILASVIGRN